VLIISRSNFEYQGDSFDPFFSNTIVIHHSCFDLDFALTTVLRSKTGRSGSGSSMTGIMIAKSKYQPSISAAKKLAPHATTKYTPVCVAPCAVKNSPAAAKPKPIVAHMKIATNIALVRVEQRRKSKDSIPRATG
jgi:hypothetical protein